MNKYVFRVLRENEIQDKGLGKGLYSKKFDMQLYQQNGSFSTALDNITTHIVNGNRTDTQFISCSTDFIIDLEKYATEQLELRPYLAIIENHNSSTIDSDIFLYIREKIALVEKYYELIFHKQDNNALNEFKKLAKEDEFLVRAYEHLENSTDWMADSILKNPEAHFLYHRSFGYRIINNLKQSDIKKMVIDASHNIYNDEVYNYLMKHGFIHNKSGFVKENFNQWEYGTARKSCEVLVLNYISESDFKILSPLQYDILYALLNNYSIYDVTPEIIKQLDTFSEKNFDTIKSLLTDELEILVFNEMYYKRKSILNLIETGSGFNNFIYYKKQVLSRCIEYLNRVCNTNYNKNYIRTLEQNIDFKKSPIVGMEDDKIIKK